MFKLGRSLRHKPEPTRAEVTERMRRACEHVQGWFMFGAILCILQMLGCASTVSFCLRDAAATCDDNWWLALWTTVQGVAGSTGSVGNSWGNAMTAIVTTGLSATLMLVVCAEGARCFKAIVEAGTPFTPEALKHMRAIRWLVIALALYPPVLATPFNMLLCPPGGAFAQFVTDGGGYRSLGALDFIVFLVGIAALIRVFEYGCILQRQDDETI